MHLVVQASWVYPHGYEGGGDTPYMHKTLSGRDMRKSTMAILLMNNGAEARVLQSYEVSTVVCLNHDPPRRHLEA